MEPTLQESTKLAEQASINERMQRNLLAIASDRDETAFADFYAYFAGRVKSFLMGKGMNEDTSEELVQEIMITVWRKAQSYDPGKAAASTWLFTIARNRRIDYLRGNSRIEVELDDYMLEEDDTVVSQEASLNLIQQSSILEKTLTKLPQDQQQVMHLSYYRGLSHGDIAQWLSIPIGTVKSRIRLAMQTMRSEFSEQESE